MNKEKMPTKKNIASAWARLVAYLADTLILVAIFATIVLLLISPTKLKVLFDAALANLILLIFLALFIPLINILLISKVGGTIGKLLTGIRIIDNQGSNLSFLRAFFRTYIGYTVSRIFLWLGFIWIFVDKQKQGWHDMLTESWVVVKNKSGLVIGILATILLLILNIFLGRTIYQRFNQNKDFFYSIFSDVASEFKGPKDSTINEDFDFSKIPSDTLKVD